MFLHNYLSVFIYLSLSLLLSTIIFFLSYILSQKADDVEKLSAYECGFNPFEDSRSEFDVRFYIVAILFLIFDLEISFLFPFAVSYDLGQHIALYAMLFFLFVLTVGFVYEWKKGALDWD
jgi:NADH-quinone oxidoreductase subunit A